MSGNQNKPKPIRRHGPVGLQPLSRVISPPPTRGELLIACLQLGQKLETANDTVTMYEDEILDPGDVALMEDVILENRKSLDPPVLNIEKIKPIDPRGTRHFQKVTQRDSSGRIIGLKDV